MPDAVGYEFGPFYLNVDERVLLFGKTVAALQPKAIETLLLLVENQGKVVSRECILARVWPGTFVEEGNVSQSIWSLRKVLIRPDYPDPIETIPRRGSLFSAEVRPQFRETGIGQTLSGQTL